MMAGRPSTGGLPPVPGLTSLTAASFQMNVCGEEIEPSCVRLVRLTALVLADPDPSSPFP